MYKKTSKAMQGRADRILMRDMASNYVPTESEELEASTKRAQQLQAQIKTVTNRNERNAIGQEICRINMRINELKKKIKPKRNGIENFFVKAAKQRLSPYEYDAIMSAAQKMFDAGVTQ